MKLNGTKLIRAKQRKKIITNQKKNIKIIIKRKKENTHTHTYIDAYADTHAGTHKFTQTSTHSTHTIERT